MRPTEGAEIEAVVLATPDMQGKLYGKSMPASLFLAEESMEVSDIERRRSFECA